VIQSTRNPDVFFLSPGEIWNGKTMKDGGWYFKDETGEIEYNRHLSEESAISELRAYLISTCPKKVLAELAKEAIDIQDACNPYSLSWEFWQMTRQLHLTLSSIVDADVDADVVRHHPIWKLWVAKLAKMACISGVLSSSQMSKYRRALKTCMKLRDAFFSPAGKDNS
jgi:hypothetical protein